MPIALAIFGVAFAAFCVWLTVRIINRRERWAIVLAVGLAPIFASAYLAADYLLHGVPPGEEESEGVTIKVTATVLAFAGGSVWLFAWLCFGRSNHPGD